MATNKKPRKKYRGDNSQQALAILRKRGTAMALTGDGLYHVAKLLGKNKVAAAVEAKHLENNVSMLIGQMSLAEDGSVQNQLLSDLVNLIGLGMTSLDRYESDDDGVHCLFLDALERLTKMGEAGNIWYTDHTAVLIEAVEYAGPVLSAVDVDDRFRAAKLVNELRLKAIKQRQVENEIGGD